MKFGEKKNAEESTLPRFSLKFIRSFDLVPLFVAVFDGIENQREKHGYNRCDKEQPTDVA